MMQFNNLTALEAAKLEPFKKQLSLLHNLEPPISREKLDSITNAALEAKVYKFVVLLLEEFVKECTPTRKLSGLEVLHSIIRESRRRFGVQNDLFAARFARNFPNTFVHLYKCPPADKECIIRVLNGWKKDNIFGANVIDPLYELANPENPIWEQIRHPKLDTARASDPNLMENSFSSKIVNTSSNIVVSPKDINKRLKVLEKEEAGFDQRVLGRVAQLPLAKQCKLFEGVEMLAPQKDSGNSPEVPDPDHAGKTSSTFWKTDEARPKTYLKNEKPERKKVKRVTEAFMTECSPKPEMTAGVASDLKLFQDQKEHQNPNMEKSLLGSPGAFNPTSGMATARENVCNDSFFGYGRTPVPDLQWMANYASWMAAFQGQNSLLGQTPILIPTTGVLHYHQHHHTFDAMPSISGLGLENQFGNGINNSSWNSNLTSSWPVQQFGSVGLNRFEVPTVPMANNPNFVYGSHCAAQAPFSATGAQAFALNSNLMESSGVSGETFQGRKRIRGRKRNRTRKNKTSDDKP